MTDKVCSLLGFAAKAGALRFGFAGATEAVKRRSAKCVLYACDISEKSKKEILFYCDKFGVKALELCKTGMEDLSKYVGRRCGVIAIIHDSFSNPVISYLTSGREVI
ncbi:MAG: ribosomal L7Ae/L30e/S12e/Gadd45 family protein [Clostridia bacterium]|nr:ribosomal L7Ae/L30e/S12e/Gadd45 family protein [Clostridia bacterium]